MKMTIAPGVFDILPQEEKEPWRCVHLWTYVEAEIRKIAAEYHFQEIRTPIFERTELFQRSVGETTDIVSKEMYTFEDKGGRSMSLRPEGTAAAMRAFIENQLSTKAPIHKFFYIGPMFRYERTQAGRYRQHHQFGVEVIGSPAPEQDVELIDLVYTLYQRLGLKNLKVNVNTIGNLNTRQSFKEALKSYLMAHYQELSPESQARYETNPLRILDSKDPKDREIIAKAPSILDFLNEECKSHFERVLSLLNDLQIPFEVNPTLVRGLDYYNKTVFEIVAGDLGAQNSVAGGGRYDGLLKTLGGPDLPATGFATGIERIIQTMLKQQVAIPAAPSPTIFLIPMGENGKRIAFPLLQEFRKLGISALMEYGDRKINKAMQYANNIRARYILVIGDEEVASGKADLKEMATGLKRTLPLKQIPYIFYYEQKNEEFLKYLNDLSDPFVQEETAKFFIDNLNEAINTTAQATQTLQFAVKRIQEIL